MSENNSPEILNKKRGRGHHSKLKDYRIISNKFKLGSKQKIKSPHLNVIKPKAIKKEYSYNTQNANQYNTIEKNFPDEESDLKREVAAAIKRLKEIKCYRWMRHNLWLPVRGQLTRKNAKTAKKLLWRSKVRPTIKK